MLQTTKDDFIEQSGCPPALELSEPDSVTRQSFPARNIGQARMPCLPRKTFTIFTDHLQLSLYAVAILLTNVRGQFTLPDVEMNSHEAPVPLADAVVFCPTRPPCILPAAGVLNFA
jgi:hypothetical protein